MFFMKLVNMKIKLYLLATINILIAVHILSCTAKKSSDSELKFSNNISATENKIEVILNDTINIVKASKIKKPIYAFDTELQLNELGVRSNFKKTMKSNIYITKNTPITQSIKNFSKLTDYLENYWETVKKTSGADLTWLYAYHVKSNAMRIYPWVDMVPVVGPSIKWSLVSYFQEDKNVREYMSKSICTRPYDDIGGTGTNISCCRLYKDSDQEDSLILSCLDVSIKSIFETFRKEIITTNSKAKSILLISRAPEIAYKRSLIYDLATGNKTYTNSEIETKDKYKLVGSYKLLNFDIYIESVD